MEKTIICKGRSIGSSELSWLNSIVQNNPDWSRHKITKYICTQWDWKTYTGQLKTFAARSLINKLEQQNLVVLPPIQVNFRRPPRPAYPEQFKQPQKYPVKGSLHNHSPLSIKIPSANSYEDHCAGYYLKNFHYLGFNRTVGENLKYLIKDRNGRDVACLLFGSAAWKIAPRDKFIGWKSKERENNLNFLTNNTRFLILPWVNIPNLASHILGAIARRIQKDWMTRYAHPVHMMETFVDTSRFQGTCYKAANWKYIGKTKGRSRQDKQHKLSVPVKTIWILPLTKNFHQVLGQ